MKWRYDLLLVAALTNLFYLVGMSAGQGPDRVGNLDVALKMFPGYHLLTVQERDSDVRAFILKHFAKRNPSIVRADFDGDGHLDYAMLLKNDKSEAAKVVVLLCSGEAKCRSVYDVDITGYAEIAYLRPVAAGSVVSETEAVDTASHPAAIRLKTSGVQVTYFQKGAVVLYWSKKLKKIEEIQTAD